MKDDTSNPNIEWKKSGFDNKERITLKVNLNEAASYDAKKNKNPLQGTLPNPENLPRGLKKIRKKIRDVFDEEDDEEEFQFNPSGLEVETSNSLINALNDDEKKILKQHEGLQTIKMQQTAGKMEAIAVAGNLARQAGLGNIEKKLINNNLQMVAPAEEIVSRTIRDVLSGQEHVKVGEISQGKIIQTLRGVKRIKAIGGNSALHGLKIEDLQKVGEQTAKGKEVVDNKEVAELILAKSGQNLKKKKPEKNDSSKPKNKIESNTLSHKRNLSLKNLNDRT